jgi:hypothetical protein
MDPEVVDIDQLRAERLRRSREFYLSDEGFLDFVRDSGAAPDAEFQPHGKHCQDLITWEPIPDPGAEGTFWFKSKLVLWPRGSFKSQVFNVGQVAWLIARDPNLRILVCSETARQAKKFVAETMKIVDNEWFKELFGDHTLSEWKPGSGTFTSSLRTRKGVKDPTLAASGVGEVQTGAHWDFVFMDDVCSQENTRTPESIESLWMWFGEIQAQLDPGVLAPDRKTIWGGKLFMIGTLHHFDDIYCKIIGNPDIARDFDISQHAWCDPIVDPGGDAGTDLFFPSRLTRAFVADRKRKLPSSLYACFYENQPNTGDKQIFKPEYFRVIPDESIPHKVWTYILTDFAFIADEIRKKRADKTAFWVVSLDTNRVAYVWDVIVGEWRTSDSVRIVCDLWNSYQWANMKGVTLEKTTYSEVLLGVFEEVRRQTFVRPNLIVIAGRSQETKTIRIQGAEQRWANNEIYFAQSLRSNHRKWKAMFDAMTKWPFTSHDDVPDAISDLDKRDETGRGLPKFYLPGPPASWSAQPVRSRPQPMINGRMNPTHGYPAREFIKAQQHGGHDLWGSRSTPRPDQPTHPHREFVDSIFRNPHQRPTQLE